MQSHKRTQKNKHKEIQTHACANTHRHTDRLMRTKKADTKTHSQTAHRHTQLRKYKNTSKTNIITEAHACAHGQKQTPKHKQTNTHISTKCT